METWNTLRKKYGVRIFIVILSMLFLCTFVSRKEGYHMDEILAFQLANAEFNPWIVPTQPVGRLAKFMTEHIDGDTLGETVSNIGFIVQDTLKNRGSSILANYKADVYEAPVWISREMFQAYVRCDSGDDFNLLSVYFNVKDDNHPPLHFMLLHLMTSVFKGEISPWHGCVINLVAMAGVLWLLGQIGDIVFKKKSSTYALMILAGFSVGMVATGLWIRMYALLTLWTVWGLYLHLKKLAGPMHGSLERQNAVGKPDGLKEQNVGVKLDCLEGKYAAKKPEGFCRINTKNGKCKWLGSVGIFTVTVLSFWTQYFGLFFILPLALVTVILLFKDKRIQELWAYIRTMITAAVIGVCVYPFAIGDVLFSDRGAEALSQWQNGLTEYLGRLQAFGSILAENVAGNGILFAAAVLIPAAVICVRRLQMRGSGEGQPVQAGQYTEAGGQVEVRQQVWTGGQAEAGQPVWTGRQTEAGQPAQIAWHAMAGQTSGQQFIMVSVPALVYSLLAAKMSPYFVDRYIMALFPITALLIVWLWDCAAGLWKPKKANTGEGNTKTLFGKAEFTGIVCVAAAILLVVFQNVKIQGQHTYLYTGYEEQLQVAEEYRDYPMVCLYQGYGFYQNVMEMEQYAQTMLVKPEELALMDESRVEVIGEGYVALIKDLDIEAAKEQLEQIMEVFGGTKAGLLYEGGAFGDVIYFIGN